MTTNFLSSQIMSKSVESGNFLSHPLGVEVIDSSFGSIPDDLTNGSNGDTGTNTFLISTNYLGHLAGSQDLFPGDMSDERIQADFQNFAVMESSKNDYHTVFSSSSSYPSPVMVNKMIDEIFAVANKDEPLDYEVPHEHLNVKSKPYGFNITDPSLSPRMCDSYNRDKSIRNRSVPTLLKLPDIYNNRTQKKVCDSPPMAPDDLTNTSPHHNYPVFSNSGMEIFNPVDREVADALIASRIQTQYNNLALSCGDGISNQLVSIPSLHSNSNAADNLFTFNTVVQIGSGDQFDLQVINSGDGNDEFSQDIRFKRDNLTVEQPLSAICCDQVVVPSPTHRVDTRDNLTLKVHVPKKRKLLESGLQALENKLDSNVGNAVGPVDSSLLHFHADVSPLFDPLELSSMKDDNMESCLKQSQPYLSQDNNGLFQDKLLCDDGQMEEDIKSDEDSESDYENIINEAWNGALPHKKRIPRKMKQLKKSKSLSCFKCNKCGFFCGSQQEYDSHKEIHSTAKPLFSCELCHTNFNEQIKFFEHLKLHYEPDQVQENRVPQINNDETLTYVPDIVQIHDNTKDLQTEWEAAQEEDSKLVKNVKQAGKTKVKLCKRKVVCHICKEEFNSQAKYMNHVELIHNTESKDVQGTENKDEEVEKDTSNITNSTSPIKLFSCSLCQQTYMSKVKLVKHKKKVHDIIPDKKGTQTYQCEICDKVFSYRNSLIYHLRKHNNHRPYECPTCGKTFLASGALKVHLRLHTGDRPFKCEHCDLCFRQWADLKYHTVSKHSTLRQFQCEYCGKDFARKYSLVVHRRIHTGEKDYRCDFCEKTFRAASYLKNHRRIHTGEKPYPCQICGKPFRVKSDMRRHMNTHSKDPLVTYQLEQKSNEVTLSLLD